MAKAKVSEKIDKRVSMREAFENISPKINDKKIVKPQKENMFREFFWNYPDFIIKLFKLTSPLSTILLFSIIGFGLFTFLRSDTFAQRVSSRKSTSYVEGRVGAISTFNPLFSNQNDVDKAIQELVFEKFVYIDSKGNLLPAIAKEWRISDDGKSYEFDIELDHIWSDGTPVTIDDVFFTFDTAIKLSSNQGYDTIASGLVDVEMEIIDIDTIKFILPEINAVFPELVSVYIVPKHILEEVSLSDMPFDIFSRNPIGSGPYRIYRSEPNIVYLQSSDFFEPGPNISNIVVRIYSNLESMESAFRNGLLDAIIVSNDHRSDFIEEYPSFITYELDLPYRQRILFFNLRKEKFQNQSLRKGISMLVDKEELLKSSGINAEIIHGPICTISWAYSSDPDYPIYNPEEAIKALKDAGYSKNEVNGYFEDEDGKLLTFTVSYLENEINEKLLKNFIQMLDREGVIVSLEPLAYSQLTQEIIATRSFEVLMYEIEVTVDPDQYNLWHSLQKEYPNLNLSGYEFSRIDILLEEGRRVIDKKERKEDYALFQKYLTQDVPAIFLYRPSYLYLVRDTVSGINHEDIVRLEDIYRDIYNWTVEN